MRKAFGDFKPLVFALLAIPVVLVACEEQNTYVEPPPPKVTVAQPVIQEVTDFLEATGSLVASAEVEVRARVSGVLQSMQFTPGTPVKAGVPLFMIDPEEYAADLEAAQAELASAKARQVETQQTLERSATLKEKGHVSQAKLDEAEADARAAKAEVLRREAMVDLAEISRGYTEVTAPIDGRVGRNLVDIGNLVGADSPTLLTTVTQYDPIYIYFNLNERDLLRLAPLLRERLKKLREDFGLSPAARVKLPVFISLSNEEGYPHQGLLDYGDSALDPGTGTLQLRAVFDNPETPPALYPGLFARVRVPVSVRPDMPLVLDRAIGLDQSGHFVLVLNESNVVEKHNVVLGDLVGALRVIEDGVRAEDRIVVNGIQRARPGAAVDPEAGDMAAIAAKIMPPPAASTAPDDGVGGQETPQAEIEPEASSAAQTQEVAVPAEAQEESAAAEETPEPEADAAGEEPPDSAAAQQ
jgi:RND family efflux transporter MFP subunit